MGEQGARTVVRDIVYDRDAVSTSAVSRDGGAETLITCQKCRVSVAPLG